MKKHKERKHSKFSASGAERWFKCPGSVDLSEGLPDTTSAAAEEGTKAHEVLEAILKNAIEHKSYTALKTKFGPEVPKYMIDYGMDAANFVLQYHKKAPGSDFLVEERVLLDFIHPEAFGSLDVAVVEQFGILDVFDYKFGKKLVNPTGNLQFIFYALALAHRYDWNFAEVRMWTLQPRVGGFDGYVFWKIDIKELKKYESIYRKAIKRVEAEPTTYVEGDWCFFCKAKFKCPVKNGNKVMKMQDIFGKGK